MQGNKARYNQEWYEYFEGFSVSRNRPVPCEINSPEWTTYDQEFRTCKYWEKSYFLTVLTLFTGRRESQHRSKHNCFTHRRLLLHSRWIALFYQINKHVVLTTTRMLNRWSHWISFPHKRNVENSNIELSLTYSVQRKIDVYQPCIFTASMPLYFTLESLLENFRRPIGQHIHYWNYMYQLCKLHSIFQLYMSHSPYFALFI